MLQRKYLELLESLDNNIDIYIKFNNSNTKAFLAELEITSIFYCGPDEYSYIKVKFNNKFYDINRIYIESDLTTGTRIYAPIIIYSNSLGVPIGYTTKPIKGAKSYCNIEDYRCVYLDESKFSIINYYNRLILAKPKLDELTFKTKTVVTDLLSSKVFKESELDNILYDLGIIINSSHTTIYNTTGNSYETDSKNKKRLLVKNEPKLYFSNSIESFKPIKTQFIFVRDSLQNSMLKNKNLDFRMSEYTAILDIAKKNYNYSSLYLLARLKLRPDEINYERIPIGNRKTIDGFILLNPKTHELINDDILYLDGTISSISASYLVELRKAIIESNARELAKMRK